MKRAKIRIGAIGRVAQTIIRQVDDLGRRVDLVGADGLAEVRIFAPLIFVEIVADVER